MTEELTPEQRRVKALDEHRGATQFGGERGNTRNQEKENSTKPWSIRFSMRYLAKQEVDMADPKAFQKLLPKKPTVAQVIAANALAKASKADMRAVEFATDQIDGKLVQTNLNADLEKFDNMTEEELYAYNAELDRRIAAAQDALDGPEPGADNQPEAAPAASTGEEGRPEEGPAA